MMNVVPGRYTLFVIALVIATTGSTMSIAECLTTWMYRIPVSINNLAGASALTDHQVLVTVNTQSLISSGKMRTDGGDIRFIADDKNCTQACYWIENGLNTPSTRIWVKVPSVGAGMSNTIYMYYGNKSAASTADVRRVFLLFDSFDGNAIDAATWSSFGPSTATVSGGAISFGMNSTSRVIRSNATFTPPVITEMQVLEASGAWPNIAQLRSGTWNGYGPVLGGALIRIGWTRPCADNYSGTWESHDRPAGTVAGLWSFAWSRNDNQQFTWPGGSVSTNYTTHPIGPVNVALGLLERKVHSASLSVDWVRVRKHASPEPVTSTGSEQIQGQTQGITRQPVNVAACEETPASFNVQAAGAGLTYQWRRNGTNIPSATGSSYSIPTVRRAHAGTYDVVIKFSNGSSAISDAATLIVNTAPVITEQPLDQTASIGELVTFAVQATGSGTLTYQWQKDGRDIPNTNAPSYTINSVELKDIGDYDVVIRGELCPSVLTVSGKASLMVPQGNGIIEEPESQITCLGSPASFAVTATGDGLKYQWRRNGAPIPSATSRQYEIGQVRMEHIGNYDVVVQTRQGKSFTSRTVALTMREAPTVRQQPQSVAACKGEPVRLSIDLASAPIGMQWRRNGIPVPGATREFIEIAAMREELAGAYDVVITDACGSSTVSDQAKLTLNSRPVIIAQPESQWISMKGTALFTVKATGRDLHYQWRRNGVDIPGATASAYEFDVVSDDYIGGYDVIITDACGNSIASATATLSYSLSAVPWYADASTGSAQLKAIPHPARGLTQLQITLPQGVHADAGTRLLLFNLAGQPVLDLSESFAGGGFSSARLDVSSLPAGTYYCHLATAEWSGALGAIVVEK